MNKSWFVYIILTLLLVLGCHQNCPKKDIKSTGEIEIFEEDFNYYDFKDTMPLYTGEMISFINKIALCDSTPCNQWVNVDQPCHYPDGSHYWCFANKEFATYFFLDDTMAFLVEYVNTGSCGYEIEFYSLRISGTYEKIYSFCGIVDSVVTKPGPDEVFLYDGDVYHHFVWNTDVEDYISIPTE